MRTRIYVDGKPAWSENEPAYARRLGHGGTAMGFYSGTILKAPPSAVRTAAAQRNVERRKAARARARVT